MTSADILHQMSRGMYFNATSRRPPRAPPSKPQTGSMKAHGKLGYLNHHNIHRDHGALQINAAARHSHQRFADGCSVRQPSDHMTLPPLVPPAARRRPPKLAATRKDFLVSPLQQLVATSPKRCEKCRRVECNCDEFYLPKSRTTVLSPLRDHVPVSRCPRCTNSSRTRRDIQASGLRPITPLPCRCGAHRDIHSSESFLMRQSLEDITEAPPIIQLSSPPSEKPLSSFSVLPSILSVIPKTSNNELASDDESVSTCDSLSLDDSDLEDFEQSVNLVNNTETGDQPMRDLKPPKLSEVLFDNYQKKED